MVNTRVRTAAVLLGIGLGGFIDGIVLHQVFNWHNMFSAVVPPTTMEAMQFNMRADGLFHLATWIITLAGVLALWSAFAHGGTLPSTRAFLGTMLMGWGWFNIVEGVIDHHVLALHHVRDLPEHVPALDWAFLLVGGAGFVALGLFLRRSPPRALPERRAGYERRGTALQ
jgi:uncharacterized membrane protein